ncbi:DUF3849 domain-containing protein [Lachnoclostridium sp. An169]|uniref:DUF3849 domain-containing protein n=1 Tax=Lachnoclostridium sp. An169 TaxID=1965569 RepID=UPI001FA852D8|nr:DUF3849 domain-containing protein [Lachnoclostridium sp. An169]
MDLEKRMEEIYPHSVIYALEHGEIEQYRLSHNVNVECKEAIEQAIADHYRANRLGSEAVHQVVEQFGYDRVFLVLANTVRQKEWDGRISHSNKEWAKAFPVPEDKDSFGRDRNRELIVDRSHTGLMNLLLTQVRREYEELQEQKPSVKNQLHKSNGLQKCADKKKVHKEPER